MLSSKCNSKNCCLVFKEGMNALLDEVLDVIIDLILNFFFFFALLIFVNFHCNNFYFLCCNHKLIIHHQLWSLWWNWYFLIIMQCFFWLLVNHFSIKCLVQDICVKQSNITILHTKEKCVWVIVDFKKNIQLFLYSRYAHTFSYIFFFFFLSCLYTIIVNTCR